MIEVSCECDMTYRLPDRYAGKSCRCRECGEAIRIPGSKPAKTKAKVDRGGAERPARASARAREDRAPSESMHQIEPLNLNEDRSRDISSRLRLKAKAALVEEAPKKGTKREKDSGSRAKKKGHADAKPKASARKKGKRSDDDSAGRLTIRVQGSTRKSKSERAREEEPDDEGDTKRIAPPDPAEVRRRQVRLLAGSLVAAIACVVFLAVVVVRMNGAEEAQKKAVESASAAIRETRAACERQDWAGAKAHAEEAVAIIAKAPPLEDAAFVTELATFREQKKWIERIVAAQGELATAPSVAFNDFEEIARISDELLRPAGVEGLEKLAQTGHAGVAAELAKYKDDSNPFVCRTARAGLLELGSTEGDRYLEDAFRSGSPRLRQAALKRALDLGQSAPPALLVLGLEATTDPEAAVRALDALRRMGQSRDPRTLEAVLKRTHDPNEDVKKAAEEALPYVKGEKI